MIAPDVPLKNLGTLSEQAVPPLFVAVLGASNVSDPLSASTQRRSERGA